MSITQSDDLDFTEEIRYAVEFASSTSGIGDGEDLSELIRDVVWEIGHVDSPEGGGSVNLLGLGRMDDGRWISVEGWADYTGWGCQCGADFYVSASRDDVIANGVTVDMARTLGIAKPGAGIEAKP